MAVALVLVAWIRSWLFDTVYSARVIVTVSMTAGVEVNVAVGVDVAGDMGVEVGVGVNVGEMMGVEVGVGVAVDLEAGVDVGVDVAEVLVVTVVTWLAELLALFGSNS